MEKILITDDEKNIRLVLGRLLEKEGYTVSTAESAEVALSLLGKEGFDLVLLDIRMGEMDGLTALDHIKEIDPDISVIVMTAFGTMNTAVEAMKRGAYDYLTKPLDNETVKMMVAKALSARTLSGEYSNISESERAYEIDSLIGNSPPMQEVYKTIGKVASSEVTVLIRGDSGTGKELVAGAIHNHSLRAAGPFVTVNSAAVPPTLLESELFGHVKGAFTGAVAERTGKFESAQGGTIFLDEIGELSLDLQTKLLRAIQFKEFEQVGGKELIRADFRLVAATNLDLEAAIEERAFREDLYYRLNVVSIMLPRLRERKEDIPLLVDFFIDRFSQEHGRKPLGLSREALETLTNYDWPGNVRELENIIRRAVVLEKGSTILPESFSLPLRSQRAILDDNLSLDDLIESKTIDFMRRGGDGLYNKMLVLLEKPLIETILRETDGNQIRAAQVLGINRNTLRKKISELGIKIVR